MSNKIEVNDNDIQVSLSYRPTEDNSEAIISHLAGLMLELKRTTWCQLTIDVDKGV